MYKIFPDTAAVIIGSEEYCVDCAIEEIERLDLGEDDITLVPTWEEVNSPRHCAKCEGMLPYNLTREGVRYVIESLKDYLRTGVGRPEILEQWAKEVQYYNELDEEQEEVIKAFYKRIGKEVDKGK